MTTTYTVTWWNVENLFDHKDAPRTDKLKRAIGEDLKNWTEALRDRKVHQLASILSQINNGNGPDLLGVCEVENAVVVGLLADALGAGTGRTYAVAHADTVDQRGIDVAFLFDPDLFTAPPTERFQHVVMRRTATREIFQVNFQTAKGRTWSVFGNHWPSRSGGALESAGYRQIAGETLAYFHERAWEVHGEDTPALAMGDFNDEPFDVSLVRHALSTRQDVRVVNGTSPRFWNLMWDVTGDAAGTFYFDNEPNMLDQFLVDRNMARSQSPIRAVSDSVRIVTFPEMVGSGDYPAPIKFGGMGTTPANQNGFSDHFPIEMMIEELD